MGRKPGEWLESSAYAGDYRLNERCSTHLSANSWDGHDWKSFFFISQLVMPREEMACLLNEAEDWRRSLMIPDVLDDAIWRLVYKPSAFRLSTWKVMQYLQKTRALFHEKEGPYLTRHVVPEYSVFLLTRCCGTFSSSSYRFWRISCRRIDSCGWFLLLKFFSCILHTFPALF